MTTAKSKTAASMNNEAVEKVMKAGKDTFESAIKAGADAASKSVEQTAKMTQEQFDTAIKGYDEIAGLAKANVEALLASGKALATGFFNRPDSNCKRKREARSSAIYRPACSKARFCSTRLNCRSDVTKNSEAPRAV